MTTIAVERVVVSGGCDVVPLSTRPDACFMAYTNAITWSRHKTNAQHGDSGVFGRRLVATTVSPGRQPATPFCAPHRRLVNRQRKTVAAVATNGTSANCSFWLRLNNKSGDPDASLALDIS